MLEQMNEEVDIAANVFALRHEKGWTQTKLSERSGVARTTLNNLENYRRVPSMVTLRKLALALEVPVQDLLKEGRPTVTVNGKKMKLGQVLPAPRPKFEEETDEDREEVT